MVELKRFSQFFHHSFWHSPKFLGILILVVKFETNGVLILDRIGFGCDFWCQIVRIVGTIIPKCLVNFQFLTIHLAVLSEFIVRVLFVILPSYQFYPDVYYEIKVKRVNLIEKHWLQIPESLYPIYSFSIRV